MQGEYMSISRINSNNKEDIDHSFSDKSINNDLELIEEEKELFSMIQEKDIDDLEDKKS